MKEQIHIDIAPDGSLTIEAKGFSGNGCLQATAALEQALGSVTTRERKPEYFKNQRRVRVQQARSQRGSS